MIDFLQTAHDQKNNRGPRWLGLCVLRTALRGFSTEIARRISARLFAFCTIFDPPFRSESAHNYPDERCNRDEKFRGR